MRWLTRAWRDDLDEWPLRFRFSNSSNSPEFDGLKIANGTALVEPEASLSVRTLLMLYGWHVCRGLKDCWGRLDSKSPGCVWVAMPTADARGGKSSRRRRRLRQRRQQQRNSSLYARILLLLLLLSLATDWSVAWIKVFKNANICGKVNSNKINEKPWNWIITLSHLPDFEAISFFNVDFLHLKIKLICQTSDLTILFILIIAKDIIGVWCLLLLDRQFSLGAAKDPIKRKNFLCLSRDPRAAWGVQKDILKIFCKYFANILQIFSNQSSFKWKLWTREVHSFDN